MKFSLSNYFYSLSLLQQNIFIALGVITLLAFGLLQIPPRAPKDLSQAVITMERGGCPADTCPLYKIAVYGTGKVVYAGIRNVKVVGIQSKDIDSKTVRELFNAFYASGFPNQTRTVSEQNPELVLSIKLPNHTYRSSFGSEATLVSKKLSEQIDILTQSSEWVQ